MIDVEKCSKRVIDSAKSNDLSVTLRVGKDGLTSSCHGIERPTKIERTGEVENQQGCITDRRGENLSYQNLSPLLGQSLFSPEGT